MAVSYRPVVLIVRDGWGRNPHPEHDAFNAVKLAKTPRCDELLARYPWTLIHTSGGNVGLPEGTMGNSEVGHQNLGAGRVVDQESVRITKAIRSGEFFTNPTLVKAVEKAKGIAASGGGASGGSGVSGGAVHLLGIASDAGVHGLMTHLYACLELCKRCGQSRVYLHLFTDGRDTGPYTGKDFVAAIEAKCRELGVGRVASVCGRYYGMDRDNRWERVKRAYDCLTPGTPAPGSDPRSRLGNAHGAVEAIQYSYDHPVGPTQQGDEFVTPTAIGANPQDIESSRIRDGDTVIFYNYRGDRPRELVKAFVLDDAAWAQVPPSPDTGKRGFDRGRRPNVTFVTMTAYEEGLPVEVAYPKPAKMVDIAGEYLSNQGLTQFRCAETEKYPHVTFFFNDYREQPFPGERRQVAQSPKVATYDLKPQMSALEVCEIVLGRLAATDCEDFILVNFANCDMVGHTGSLPAAIQAVETVDDCVGRIVDATLARGGALIVTADHGNAEQMFDPETQSPHTAHTTYDVECIVVTPQPVKGPLRQEGRLADVFPTVLDLLRLTRPAAMTGRSLLVKG